MAKTEESVIEEKICPFCGMKFLLRLRMEDIIDTTGWIKAISAKEQSMEEFILHVTNCLDRENEKI